VKHTHTHKEKKKKGTKPKIVAKPEIYTYNANHLIPAFSTTIPGNPQYRYPVPGKFSTNRYSVPAIIRAVLKPISGTGEKLSDIEYW
jgi:hypothetical protein